ncbi:protein WHAT'S THIS FACTOR 9, mitochondrial-like [Curcuma longa]|uniref:protein WHAT'S THIS FACTOR 9, mitochondrial-like n=1 Tax=Curcuma longa TaxID=136217 RepID=UPI003D9EDD3A
MKMSCNGRRVLRKGCSEKCRFRRCLQWINATVFLAKFYGRAGLCGNPIQRLRTLLNSTSPQRGASSRIDSIAMLGGGGGGIGTLGVHRHRQQPWWRWTPQRWLEKVRLKWVKNRGLDHIIDRDTDIKAACLLKDAIAAAPSGLLPARSLAPFQKNLGLTVPVLRFLRRYPTLFLEQPHPRFPSLPAFSLAPAALLLHRREQASFESTLPDDAAHRAARLLMMARSRALPVAALASLRYDLGLPPNFSSALPAARPDLFTLSRRHSDGAPVLSLTDWPEHLAVSALQLRHRDVLSQPSYHDLKRPSASSAAPLAFPMKFPRGYGYMNKVKAWMEDFHRLPYVSPYQDASGLDPESDLMEKHVVGVLHELLSLTIHKKTKRNYLRNLQEELGLPYRFTRVFTRYPGIFYLSLKCKTSTVVLREGYDRGKLVEPHPLALLRSKVYYVMRTGLLYRGKGSSKLVLEEEDLFGEGNSKEGQTDQIAIDTEQQYSDSDEDDANADSNSEECYELDVDDSDDVGSDEA